MNDMINIFITFRHRMEGTRKCCLELMSEMDEKARDLLQRQILLGRNRIIIIIIMGLWHLIHLRSYCEYLIKQTTSCFNFFFFLFRKLYYVFVTRWESICELLVRLRVSCRMRISDPRRWSPPQRSWIMYGWKEDLWLRYRTSEWDFGGRMYRGRYWEHPH